MKTIYDMPSIQTYIDFNDGCDVHTAEMLRDMDLKERNADLLAGAAAADAAWREREAQAHAEWVAGGGFIGWFKRLMMSVPN